MDNIKNLIPAYLKDARLNCAVLIEENSPIELKSRLYIAIASSVALRSPRLSEALLTEIKAAGLDEKLYEAAVQAGSLMAMNNIYYGTRGLLPLEISVWDFTEMSHLISPGLSQCHLRTEGTPVLNFTLAQSLSITC